MLMWTLENKDTCVIYVYTLSYGHKWCFSMLKKLNNWDKLIIRTLMNGSNASIIQRFYCTALSNIMDI